jgi:hypothetical protein
MRILALILALSTLTVGQQKVPATQEAKNQLPKIPTTVDEAVLILKTRWLKPKDLNWILRNREDAVVWTLYRPFGTGVRNEFHLWGDNQALRDSCEDNNPEGCSVVILKRLWRSVREDADPLLVKQLDCQFDLAQKIKIDHTGFHKLTVGKILKAMQTQIDEQLPKITQEMCQKTLTLQVTAKPDNNCYFDDPIAADKKAKSKETSLEETLQMLGFRNFFTASHAPPAIELNFTRSCQFETPPYLYGQPR